MTIQKNTLGLVSVVIPNWNGLDLLKECLPSIAKQTYQNIEVIVVDNGSADGSSQYIKKTFPKIKIIYFSSNRGFAVAVNAGIKAAKGEYIFLLNNDTEIDKNCLSYLVKAAKKHPEVGIVAAKILNFYQRNIIDNAGDSVDIVGHSFTRGTGKKDCLKFNKEQYIFLATGGGSLFKKEVFNKIGYFDEDYFLYMEDVDLCFRAQLAGFKIWFEPKARIYHKRMATSAKNMSFVEPECFRNMTMNIIKDFPLSLILVNLNWLKILLVNINTIFFLAKKGYLLSALKSEWYVLSNFPKLLAKRRKIQGLKVVSDQYIIDNVQPRNLKIPFSKVYF